MSHMRNHCSKLSRTQTTSGTSLSWAATKFAANDWYFVGYVVIVCAAEVADESSEMTVRRLPFVVMVRRWTTAHCSSRVRLIVDENLGTLCPGTFPCKFDIQPLAHRW